MMIDNSNSGQIIFTICTKVFKESREKNLTSLREKKNIEAAVPTSTVIRNENTKYYHLASATQTHNTNMKTETKK